ncbi:MAG TPA: lipopolysaccharide kinase InaA family protein [Candidatus Acidoferrales bacterium]|nr:lipopolysaccharide kinase InaA family protein [Candidatus Acidoferrales bacterium]
MTLPAGFEWARDGRTPSVVRSDLRAWLLPLLRAAADDALGAAAQPLAGGRGGTILVHTNDHPVAIRPYRRGGLAAWVVHDTYIGWRPRPFRELATLATLLQRGAPVVEVCGACVRWLRPACYRGWIVTRYVTGAQTLWQWVSATRDAGERDAVFRQVGGAIRELHRCGGRHPDLNFNNILICPPPRAPAVLFIDFDRPSFACPSARAAAADLARLERSARRLDPHGRYVTAADLAALRTAYREPT